MIVSTFKIRGGNGLDAMKLRRKISRQESEFETACKTPNHSPAYAGSLNRYPMYDSVSK
jgi:hypothetical protein